MPWETVPLHAPPLPEGPWLNVDGTPSLATTLARGPLLIDFWEHSCINCLRTLPYLTRWHERYAPFGLTILGVHVPEFAFSRQAEGVQAAIERHDIAYPILLDNEARFWQAHAVRAWPTKILVDGRGRIRYRTAGEGRYGETERAIQRLLQEQHGPGLNLPEPMAPLRPTDVPGAICFRPTPEIHAGSGGSPIAYDPDPPSAGMHRFTPPAGERAAGRLTLSGLWQVHLEYIEAAEAGAQVELVYEAAEVNGVLGAATGSAPRLYLEQDGAPLDLMEAGDDVVVDSEIGSTLVVRTARLYNLLVNPDFAPHLLRLTAAAPGFRLYALSFVSCAKEVFEPGDLRMP